MTIIDEKYVSDTFQCAEDLTLVDYVDDAIKSLMRLLNELRGLEDKAPDAQKSVESLIGEIRELRDLRWARAQAMLKAAAEDERKRLLGLLP